MSSNLYLEIYSAQPMSRSDVSSYSEPKIFLAYPMRRNDVSLDEDEVR